MTQDVTYHKSGYILVGTFEDFQRAEQVVYDLKAAGFSPESVSVAAKDMSSLSELKADGVKETTDGAVGGALGGGALGAALGWLLAGGTALIPGIGPIVAAGIFTATVGGALIGSTLGGVAGALVATGLPEEHAREYEEHLKSGRVLVVVKIPDAEALVSAKKVFASNQSTGQRDYDLSAQAQPGDAQLAARGGLPQSQSPGDTGNSLIRDSSYSGESADVPGITTRPKV
ncbi:MAG: YsnF/AvaK protein [Chloroflexi bacterium]|jgi:hypothetical protein|nr:YsnF/AvaK protein [Chloroflexota bacterium]